MNLRIYVNNTLYTERKTYLDQRKFILVFFLCNKEKFFIATKKNIFSSNVYFFTLKTHIFKVNTLFFDLNMIFLIVNTFSTRL